MTRDMGADSEAFATACGTTLQVWEATSSGPAFAAANLPQSAPVTAVTFGSGGVLFSGDAAGHISLHHAGADVRSGSFSTAALDASADGDGAGRQVNSLAVTTGPESARLAVGCKNGAVQLWSLVDRVSIRLSKLLSGSRQRILCLVDPPVMPRDKLLEWCNYGLVSSRTQQLRLRGAGMHGNDPRPQGGGHVGRLQPGRPAAGLHQARGSAHTCLPATSPSPSWLPVSVRSGALHLHFGDLEEQLNVRLDCRGRPQATSP